MCMPASSILERAETIRVVRRPGAHVCERRRRGDARLHRCAGAARGRAHAPARDERRAAKLASPHRRHGPLARGAEIAARDDARIDYLGFIDAGAKNDFFDRLDLLVFQQWEEPGQFVVVEAALRGSPRRKQQRRAAPVARSRTFTAGDPASLRSSSPRSFEPAACSARRRLLALQPVTPGRIISPDRAAARHRGRRPPSAAPRNTVNAGFGVNRFSAVQEVLCVDRSFQGLGGVPDNGLARL